MFEAETKREFDSLVNKYKIQYDQNNCIYKFDKTFFKNNKVYIIHKNYYDNPIDGKYMIIKNNDIIEVFIYELFYELQTLEEKVGAHGNLIAVSKEFAKDVKGVVVHYKNYNEY